MDTTEGLANSLELKYFPVVPALQASPTMTIKAYSQ